MTDAAPGDGPVTAPPPGDRRAGTDPAPQEMRRLSAAVRAEGHERTGVPVVITVEDRAPTPPGTHPTARKEERRDGTEAAGRLARWLDGLGGGEDDHAVERAATALAGWHVRTHRPGSRPRRWPAPGSAHEIVTGALAAPRPGALGRVRAALLAGRVLRVVNYHSTPARYRGLVEEEVADYAARYSPVGPADIDRFLDTGTWDTPRPPVVLAFYDGFANHASVGAPACDRAGVSAWFHLTTGFLDADPAAQPAFARAHRLRVAPEEVRLGERLALSWQEVAALAERHTMGAHTATHVSAASVTGVTADGTTGGTAGGTADGAVGATDESAVEAAVHREVTGPLRRVAQATGRPAASFAWLGGTPFDAGSAAGQAVTAAGVRWFVSGLAVERLAVAAPATDHPGTERTAAAVRQ